MRRCRSRIRRRLRDEEKEGNEGREVDDVPNPKPQHLLQLRSILMSIRLNSPPERITRSESSCSLHFPKRSQRSVRPIPSSSFVSLTDGNHRVLLHLCDPFVPPGGSVQDVGSDFTIVLGVVVDRGWAGRGGGHFWGGGKGRS